MSFKTTAAPCALLIGACLAPAFAHASEAEGPTTVVDSIIVTGRRNAEDPAVVAEAQTVHGRVLELPQETPVPGALVVLVDSAARDVARAASSATGGFTLTADRPGRYRVTVRQIGWRTWESPPFELAAGETHPLVLRIDTEPYALPTITV